ncbi:zinc ribbon domain-containing protein [Pseudanabaenaceae cyanobacterium LEGE 13415]|nr:zinc ribbon domain-containing protein [Pseudanabaenaceae cyanobacterium LEGE 13415]
MLNCPRCGQSIQQSAIACPRCRTPLKAHGHPGIVLHRATGAESLCKSCLYDADDTCNYPQRPDARECTMYHDVTIPIVSTPQRYETSPGVWIRRNAGWIALVMLIILSFGLALSRR